jgi:ABC-type oligopeptide transport system ATPase subunit
MSTSPLLQVNELSVSFGRRRPVRVVDNVSFAISAGETVALVGESGSGKTTIGRAILGLVKAESGYLSFDGKPIRDLDARARRELAADLQVIFQNPYGSLNPSIPIGRTLTEPLRAQKRVTTADALEQIAKLLKFVGLPDDAGRRYPAQFSGGQRQRIAIARAVSIQPKLIVCDEPTSALDVSTQATILELLGRMQRDFNLAYLFITHDLAVVREFADRVLVLHNGKIVEEGPAKQVCDSPQHPYTQSLIAAAPVPDPIIQRQRREALSARFDELAAESA